MNKQREVIYGERRKVLEGENLRDHIQEMIRNLVTSSVDIYTMESKFAEEWNMEGLENYVMNLLNLDKRFLIFEDIESLTKEDLTKIIMDKAEEKYISREADFGEERFREIERVILLQVVDTKWMDHIDAMDQLRQGIGLRALGQQDPVRAYQIEGFDMFDEMTSSIWEDTVKFLYQVENPDKVQRKKVAEPILASRGGSGGGSSGGDGSIGQQTVVNKGPKIGRNDPCPCGSGKKYKKCCGR